jgi:hypothetical protein
MLKFARYLEYDVASYPFARILEREVFRVRPLEQLHIFWRAQKKRQGGGDEPTYADNLTLRGLMQRQPDDSGLYKLYHAFIIREIAPLYGGKISYTNHPQMRVHLAGTPSVSKWHRDVDVTHRSDQINVFLPFTNCFGTNTLWCESDYGIQDYQPLPMTYGQAFFFDGGYLMHGSVANTSDVTRVSLDFRFAPISRHGALPWSAILAGRSRQL